MIGDHAARLVTDAKRKSQFIQKGADSLTNAKSTMASTDAFQSLKSGARFQNGRIFPLPVCLVFESDRAVVKLAQSSNRTRSSTRWTSCQRCNG